MKVWGIHMGRHVASAPIEENFVGIGWPRVGDLRNIEPNREAFKRAVAEKSPPKKAGAIPGNAGVLYRFLHEISEGDYVVYPSKEDRQVNIGRFSGDYDFVENEESGYPNKRPVQWLKSLPRSDFKQSALHEIGSAITLFEVRRHASDFLSKVISTSAPTEESISDDPDDDTLTAAVSRQAEMTTQDYIIRQLREELDPYEFEEFVAHLLECMGYTARVSQKSADGGVDIVAHLDKLGFQPPILKVQCKQITDQTSEPVVSQLLGTLGEGEYALFVNLGSYTKPSRVLERNRSKLRLIDGDELVELILEHYDDFSPRYRSLMPLKRIHVPDQGD